VITPTTRVPSGCERAPTFPSVRCRLATLARRVDDSREVVGPLEGPLLRRVQRAQRRADAAEQRAGAGQTRRARRLVRRALIELRAFESALASKRGRAVPENVRAELVELADELRTDARALRAAL
jgi:hypothetical protein